MPNFKKNTDYSMKGSTFYGKGNSSPAKVSDEMVVKAQDKLDHTELDWREPGWAKAARGIHEGAKGILGKSMKKEGGNPEGETVPEAEGQEASVEKIAEKNVELPTGDV